MEKSSKILILGGHGLLGSSLRKVFEEAGFSQILTPNRQELDLLNQEQTLSYFQDSKPDYILMCAAKVGGIRANNEYRADFILENLAIEVNTMRAALECGIQNFVFIGSSCIYPKNCPQPIKEEYLLTGELEITNEPFAVAKIAGVKMAESIQKQYGKNYFTVMPTSMYGENDNFDLDDSHVIPGLIARLDRAIKNGDSEFSIWGTGKALREFIYVEDMAKAILFLLQSDLKIPSLINIGVSEDITIADLASMIAQKMGYTGKLVYDTARPDGTIRKLLDSSKISELGWKPEVSLSEGIDRVIKSYLKQ